MELEPKLKCWMEQNASHTYFAIKFYDIHRDKYNRHSVHAEVLLYYVVQWVQYITAVLEKQQRVSAE